MANPNNADRSAKKAQDRKLKAAMDADHADGKAKAAKGPKVGTAADPVNAGAPSSGAVPGHNKLTVLAGALHAAEEKVGKGLEVTQDAWIEIGRTLNEMREFFVARDENGEPKLTDKGEQAFDKKGFGEWLNTNGFASGKISSPQSRSEAMWFADNSATIKAQPALAARCLRFSNPTHIHAEFRRIAEIVKDAKAEIGREPTEGDIADKLKSAAGSAAATAQATKNQWRGQFRKRLAKAVDGDGPIDDGFRGEAKGWQLLIMIEELYSSLNDKRNEVVTLSLDVADRDTTIANLKAKVDANEGVTDADFTVVPSEAPKPLLLKGPTVTVETAKAVTAKGKAGKPAKGKAKAAKGSKRALKGEAAMDALSAKGKAAKAASEEPIDGEFTEAEPKADADADAI